MENKDYIVQEGACPKTTLETLARIICYLFPPFIVPVIIFIWLFFCTYLSIMPILYKLYAISMTFCFTMLMPMVFIYLYQRINGKKLQGLGDRKRRFIPYILTIMGYSTCLLVMYNMHFPRYMSGIIIACLLCMTICCIINLKWKISTHMSACGLLISSLLAYSFIFLFNPIWWLCLLIMLAGIIGSARIIVKQHSLCEVTTGFIIGIFCGIIGILFI